MRELISSSFLISNQISQRTESNEHFHQELLNGFEDLKEEMILERRRAFEVLQNEAFEREKQSLRLRKQQERDQEIREEKRRWALKQRDERELMKKILELEKECGDGNVVKVSHDVEIGTDEQRFESGKEDFQELKNSKFDRVSIQKFLPGNVKRKTSLPSPPQGDVKETPKADQHRLERFTNLFSSLSHIISHRWDLTLRDGCLAKATTPRDMDYIHRLNRQSELYEKKKRLELISHSQLHNEPPRNKEINPNRSLQLDCKSHVLAASVLTSRSLNGNHPAAPAGNHDLKDFDAERWRQEIKEKRMRAELKGFQSVEGNVRRKVM